MTPLVLWCLRCSSPQLSEREPTWRRRRRRRRCCFLPPQAQNTHRTWAEPFTGPQRGLFAVGRLLGHTGRPGHQRRWHWHARRDGLPGVHHQWQWAWMGRWVYHKHILVLLTESNMSSCSGIKQPKGSGFNFRTVKGLSWISGWCVWSDRWQKMEGCRTYYALRSPLWHFQCYFYVTKHLWPGEDAKSVRVVCGSGCKVSVPAGA